MSIPSEKQLSEMTAFDEEYPLFLPRAGSFLVGKVTETMTKHNTDMENLAVYYTLLDQRLVIGKFSHADNVLIEEFILDNEKLSLAEEVHELDSWDYETELSSIGRALLDVYHELNAIDIETVEKSEDDVYAEVLAEHGFANHHIKTLKTQEEHPAKPE